MKHKTSNIATVIKLVLVFATFSYSGALILFLCDYIFSLSIPDSVFSVFSIFLQIIGFIIFFVLFLNNKLHIKYNIKHSFFKPRINDILFSILFMLGTFMLTQSIMMLLEMNKQTTASSTNENPLVFEIIMFFVFTIICAPFIEEIVFRGIIQTFLLEKHKFFASIFISSLFFSLFHQFGGGYIYSFMFSIVVGYVYGKSHNLVLAILSHFSINMLTPLFVLLSKVDFFHINYTNGLFDFPIEFIALGFALFILCFIYFTRMTNTYIVTNEKNE